MSISVNRIREVQETKNVKAVKTQNDEQLFNYESSLPEDKFLTKKLWSDSTKAVLYNTTKELGIGNYSLNLLKTDNDAIKDAQSHLFGLMKYYEGDNNYYYEAYTTSYKDRYGNDTNGFGKLTKKDMTQEQAYSDMCKTISQSAKEVRNLVNKKCGKGAYDKLPNSIKEALIDLCYNKGLPSLSKNSKLLSSLKNKDYSTSVQNMAFLHSGKAKTSKEPSAGLYKRSLNRMILGSRDLKGKEATQTKEVIKNIYHKALNLYKKNGISTIELEKIYSQYTNGKIDYKPRSAASKKMLIDNSYRGKGLTAVARTAYSKLGNQAVSFKEFLEEVKKINNNPDSISIGQYIKIPYVENIIAKDGKEVSKVSGSDSVETVESVNNNSEQMESVENDENVSTKKEEKGFFRRIWDGFVDGLKAIGNFFKNLFGFGDNEENYAHDHDHETFFKKMMDMKDVDITETGDLLVATYNYEVEKGDNLYALSERFGSSVDRICNDNGIKNKNNIEVGQNIKFQKLGYQVKKGDNLFRISQKFGLTVEILKDLNNIQDVDKIEEDQMLEIPGFIYEVKPKDNLFRISKQVGVSVNDLKKVNKLTSDIIEPGQKIIVTYNDSDYAVSNDKKVVTVDKKTNVKTEVVDMSSNNKLATRPLLQKKRKINGKVVATRAVFNPTKKGALSGKTIILNAGHGYSQAGTDPGALSRSKDTADEWLINYDNAMRLKDRLCRQGAKVIFLQGHVNLITKELAKKENKADLFMSIHVNSFDGKTKDRTQIYRSKNRLAINKKSKKLADTMEKNLDRWIKQNEQISKKDRFINGGRQDYAQSKDANYAVIREAERKQNIPAVLWEIAFMVSPKGRERMNNPKVMENYSDMMEKSIVEYFS